MKHFTLSAYILVLIAILINFSATAQEITISDGGFYTGCSTTIFDTGGNQSDYGNNENIAFTICPDFDAGEISVTLNFIIFDLGEGDQMNVHQGINTLFPLQGTYTGQELSNQFITTAVDNPTGCLTVQFVSDAASTGNFAFLVSCGVPCLSPFAIIETSGSNPMLACVGEELTFDGNQSIFADGTELATYNWTFGDGINDSTSGLMVNHSYDTPGEYIVQLELVDDHNCRSTNLTNIQILVGTEPSFEGSSQDIEICLGQEVELEGVVTGNLWSGLSSPPSGGFYPIPDDQTQCATSEILLTNFTDNQIITQENDIENIFINMEHSYMGDLIITFICPNGQTMVAHQQGGTNTFLGVPIDDDSNLDPGVGFDYFWAPNAPNDTWANESFDVSTLPSGIYSTIQPFSNLIGCPLNGIWQIEVCDIFGSDNGFVFDWTINFNSDLQQGYTEFTPVYGADCDSSFWAGPFVTSTSTNCNNITILPTSLGLFEYTYSATDNHGCIYEYSLNVNVVEPLTADVIESELFFCSQPLQLNSFVSNPTSGAEYNYQWLPIEGLDNPNIANPTLSELDSSEVYTVFIFETGSEDCGAYASINILVSEPVISEVFASICEDQEYVLPDGTIVSEPGEYMVVLESTSTGCDSIVLTEISLVEIDNTLNVLEMTLISNADDAEYQWLDCNNGNQPIPDETNQVFVAETTGNYAVMITIGECTETSECLFVTPVGINGEVAFSKLQMYPNPTSGIVIFELDENALVTVIDATGRTVRSFNLQSGRQEIDLAGISEGLYYVSAVVNNQVYTEKLIILR
jgi:subtilisin-like proprotein convertase family protein